MKNDADLDYSSKFTQRRDAAVAVATAKSPRNKVDRDVRWKHSTCLEVVVYLALVCPYRIRVCIRCGPFLRDRAAENLLHHGGLRACFIISVFTLVSGTINRVLGLIVKHGQTWERGKSKFRSVRRTALDSRNCALSIFFTKAHGEAVPIHDVAAAQNCSL